MTYVFGPVPSRRLGRSLGVDVVPFKTCTYDCVYCQVGRTTRLTLERKEWVPLEEVLAELEAKLASRPDYVTLSGSGEPTLYSRLGELIDRIKAMTDVPVGVLTNGSLLWREDVRRELLHADLVMPSLDAGEEETFRKVNRPPEDLSFNKMLGGLAAFRREFRGKYWLEVLLVEGFNATEAEVRKIARCASLIGPDRVQLNTVTRPPAETIALPVSPERLKELARLFDPPAEVIADFAGPHETRTSAAGPDEVLQMLRRRPCTTEDIAAGLGLHPAEVVKHVAKLAEDGLIESSDVGGRVYWRARP